MSIPSKQLSYKEYDDDTSHSNLHKLANIYKWTLINRTPKDKVEKTVISLYYIMRVYLCGLVRTHTTNTQQNHTHKYNILGDLTFFKRFVEYLRGLKDKK